MGRRMHIRISARTVPARLSSARRGAGGCPARAAARQDIRYEPAALPSIDTGKEYAASAIITAAMKVFAKRLARGFD